MMKTILSLAIATLIASSAFSQEKSAVYLKGGLNIANISTTSDGHIDNANSLASFHIGFMGDIPVGKYFGIQPGILFTGKGAKTQTGQPGDNYYFKATSNPYYVEIPVNFVAKIPLDNKTSNFFIGAGPYAAIGVSGKNKTEGNAGPISFNGSDNIKFSNDDPTTFNQQEGSGLGIIRRFDFGLNATAGFELDKLLLSLNYGYGLTKINSVESNSNDKNKHRVLGISVGLKL